MSNLKADPSSSVKRHMVSVCAFVRPTEVKIDILKSILVIVGTAMLLLAILGIGIMYQIFATAHHVIRPLRKLNSRMTVINADNEMGGGGADFSLKFDEEKETSQEIQTLYKVFGDLIQDRQFSQNAFLKRSDKDDVLSIIDLADACKMYESE